MANFGDVRALLQDGESMETWEKLSGALLDWYGREPLEEVAQYCASHVDHWPKEMLTLPPDAWFKQPATQLATNPVHAFFSHCITTRHDLLAAEVMAELAGHKALKPPKFIDADKLGALRWRHGGELDEKTRKRVLTWMRNACMTHGDEKLERLRLLLDDEDCQRWSAQIYSDWIAADRPSSHRWAMHMVAYWGTLETMELQPSDFTYMAAVRAEQYFDVIAEFESKDAYTLLSRVALEVEPMYYRVRQLATDKVNELIRKADMTPQRFLATKTSVDKPLYEALQNIYRGGAIEPHLTVLERALGDQRQIPGWVLNALMEEGEEQGSGLRGVLLRREDDKFMRVVDRTLADIEGELVECRDSDFFTLAHPAQFVKDEDFNAWRELLAEESLLDAWNQLTRTFYLPDTPLIPEDGIEIPTRRSLDATSLTEGGTGEYSYGYITQFYDVFGSSIYALVYSSKSFCINSIGHKTQWKKGDEFNYVEIETKLGKSFWRVKNPATHSELCRRVRIVDAQMDATMPKSRRKTRTPRVMPS